MHDTAHKIAKKFFELYWNSNFNTVAELGSYDVNGSLRSVKPIGSNYIGLDLDAGPSVDIVIDDPGNLPLPDSHCDCVVASSVLEHDRFFWQSFLELCRITKPGGFIYINCPSNGDVHRYPADYWRFYPDAARGLVDWAKAKSFEVNLVESFVAERIDDQWNDFVAVFQRGAVSPRNDQHLLSNHFECNNVYLFDATELVRPENRTQDRRLLDLKRDELQILHKNEKATTAVNPADLAAVQVTEINQRLGNINHLQHFLGAALDREFPVVRSLLNKLDMEIQSGALHSKLQELLQRVIEVSQVSTDMQAIAHSHADQFNIAHSQSSTENVRLNNANNTLLEKMTSAEQELALAQSRLLQSNANLLEAEAVANRAEEKRTLLEHENTKLLGQLALQRAAYDSSILDNKRLAELQTEAKTKIAFTEEQIASLHDRLLKLDDDDRMMRCRSDELQKTYARSQFENGKLQGHMAALNIRNHDQAQQLLAFAGVEAKLASANAQLETLTHLQNEYRKFGLFKRVFFGRGN